MDVPPASPILNKSFMLDRDQPQVRDNLSSGISNSEKYSSLGVFGSCTTIIVSSGDSSSSPGKVFKLLASAANPPVIAAPGPVDDSAPLPPGWGGDCPVFSLS